MFWVEKNRRINNPRGGGGGGGGRVRDYSGLKSNDYIDDAKRNTRQLQDTKNSLKSSANKYAFEAEEK